MGQFSTLLVMLCMLAELPWPCLMVLQHGSPDRPSLWTTMALQMQQLGPLQWMRHCPLTRACRRRRLGRPWSETSQEGLIPAPNPASKMSESTTCFFGLRSLRGDNWQSVCHVWSLCNSYFFNVAFQEQGLPSS